MLMKKLSILYLFILLIVSNLIAQDCGGRYQTDLFPNVDVSTVEFGKAVKTNGDTQTLFMDIYQPVGDMATDRPIVIFCFGGSFVGGSRTSGELVTFANALAKKGYVCASIDYRLAGSPFELASEENMVKIVFSAVQDGKAAIRYFKDNYAEGNSLGVNPEQIFIGGTSAGGILAINLAYVDSLNKLPPTWQEWAKEVGGIEGLSGNSGYCSYPNGVFAFAGAIGDTSYLSSNDIPFYACHATGDQTVQYGFGPPLNGLAPVSLYGSGDIATRMTNLGIYNVLDTYSGGDHPPLSTTQQMNDTRDNLVDFLYNVLDCNSNNQQKSGQQSCDDFFVSTGIGHVNKSDVDWAIYPNPTTASFYINGDIEDVEEIFIYDATGKMVHNTSFVVQQEISVDFLSPGAYYVTFHKGIFTNSQLLMIK